MDKIRVSLGLLLVTAAVATAQSITFPSLVRKGAIETVEVDPAGPTTATSVLLRVTVADALELDRVETQPIGSLFMIRVYWAEPAHGSASEPGSCEVSLGTLAKGTYRLFIQSFCDGFLAGSTQLSFDVIDAAVPGTVLEVLDDVSITPHNPTTSETAMLTVSGNWPTGGYSLSVSTVRLAGNDVTVELHWDKPQGPVPLAVTPFVYKTPLTLRIAGEYTIHVRVYLDGQLVDAEAIPVEVVEGVNGVWPWGFLWDFFRR